MSSARPKKPVVPEPLVTLAVVDYAGIMRGRSLMRKAFDAAHGSLSCGWVPANMSLTPFDLIADANPWGSIGDLRLLPDKLARFSAWPPRAATPFDYVMSDIVELDARPWECCPRSFLKTALADFRVETGCDVIAAFEQEFQILRAGWQSAPAFAVSAVRRVDPFGPDLMAVLAECGIAPEVFVAEYGRDQFEVTTAPAKALAAADQAAVVREIVRELARLSGWRATFAPKSAVGGVGNGVHIHLSFAKSGGSPAAYDEMAPGHLSSLAASFCGGVLRHLPALTAFTAPSPISGLRLMPHNWSSSYTWLGDADREASIRLCSGSSLAGKPLSKQFNIEYRAADATASPHLTLGAILRAGIAGIRQRMTAPPLFNGDPAALSDSERERLGLRRLPQSLADALDCLERDEEVKGWFSKKALDTYTGMKRMELKLCEGLDDAALCARYAEIY